MKRLASRYFGFAGARIAAAFGRWFVLFRSAHSLTPTEFGLLTASLSIMELAIGFGDLGADSFIYARLGNTKNKVPRLVRAAMLLRLLTSAAMIMIACVVLIVAFRNPVLLPVLALIPATAMQNTATALLQKTNRFDLLALTVGVTLIATAAVVSIAGSRPISMADAAWMLVVPNVLAAITSCVTARALLMQVFARARKLLRRAGKTVLPRLTQTMVVGGLVVLYSRLDVLVVNPICGLLVQANYSGAFRLMEPFFTLFAILSTAALAELGSRSSNNAALIGQRLLALFSSGRPLLFSMIVVCSAFGAGLLIHNVMRLSIEAGWVAVGLGAAIPIRLLNSAMTTVLQRLSGFAPVMHAAVINSTVTFPVAAFLAWRIGAPGAAIGALLGELANVYAQHRSLSVLVNKSIRAR